MTGLHFSWAKGDLEAAKVYVEGGADLNKGDKLGRTSLHFAASSGNIELVDYLLK